MTESRRRLQLVVQHLDGEYTYHQLSHTEGWRVDPTSRQIIIKRVGGRDMIPLDNVRMYTVEYGEISAGRTTHAVRRGSSHAVPRTRHSREARGN